MNVGSDTKVTVLGLGYIGLPTAALLAKSGFLTAGYDVNSLVVNTINDGKIHIVEEGLEAWVSSGVKTGMLRAFNEPQPADVYIICVPTPFKLASDGCKEPDLTFIEEAVKSIAFMIKAGDLIILESTSPVGTSEYVFERLRDYSENVHDIDVAYCPERVLPGNILDEIVSNDRIVGGINPKSTAKAAQFYRNFVTGNVIETTSKVAEFCKLAENSFRDTNIAFANEISMICESMGVDVWELISLANRHPRVNILRPGVGVGGHCIAVDPWFIISRASETSRLIRQAREVNDAKPKWVIDQIRREISRFSGSPKVVCLGLSFKPDIDDLRESPALHVVDNLLGEGYDVSVVEPNVVELENYDNIELDCALDVADIVVILVGHKEFLTDDVRRRFAVKRVLDFCGVISEFS